MKVTETKTIVREGWLELPYDKVINAMKEIARAEGQEVADVKWNIWISNDFIGLASGKHEPPRAALQFREKIETKGETEIK